jgi:hypothetical protein
MTNPVHLHWLWKKGPAELRGVSSAVSLCGRYGLERGEVTAFLDDASCKRCLELAKKEDTI